MRKILFLDFDGVLHSDNCTTPFSKLELFESYLAQMPTVEVVISSAWREAYTLDQLRGLFNSLLSSRIIDITPILADISYDIGGRQTEIETYLYSNNLSEDNTTWIAVDDMKEFFEPDCPYLLRVNSNHGFGDEHGKILLQWYATDT